MHQVEYGRRKMDEPGLSRSSLTYVDGHLICLTEYGDVILLKAIGEKFRGVSHFAPTTEDGQRIRRISARRVC